MTKALRKNFHKRACEIIEASGATVTGGHASDSGEPAVREYELLTDAGRLRLAVYGDWVAGRFDLPDMAADMGVACNPHSGKWNFHCFPISRNVRKKKACQEDVEETLADLETGLASVNAREFLRSREVFTMEVLNRHLEAHGSVDATQAAFQKAKAFGVSVTVSDLPREALKDAYVANVGDVAGDRPQVVVDMARREMLVMSDIDLWARIIPWLDRNGLACETLESIAEAIPADERLNTYRTKPEPASPEPVACSPF